MKAKKIIFVYMVFVGLCTHSIIGAENSSAKEIERLKAEIKQLQTIIKSLQKKISQLRKDLANESNEKIRLLKICRKAGIDVHVKDVAKSGEIKYPDEVMYRGKKRSNEWFDEMYKRFFDKIAFVNGKYIERGILENRYARFGQKAEILQVINENELLVTDEDTIYHVHGVSGDFVDGEPFPFRGYLIMFTGTYRYVSALGSVKTIKSCKVEQYKPLTREQFSDALNSGYILTYPGRGGRRMRAIP